MGLIVIACYRPKVGKEADLLAVVKDHLPILRSQNLVTDRAPITGRAKDGTIVEVFEWISAEAVQRAHQNPAVLEMWGRFGAACDCVNFGGLPEAAEMFPHFEPVEV